MKYLMITLFILIVSDFIFSQDTVYIETNKRIGFGGQVGYFNPADADNGSFIGGIVTHARFTQNIGAEVSLNYRREKYSDGLVSVKSFPLLFSFLYYPLDYFYGIMGFGLYSTTFDYPDFTIGGLAIEDETKTEFDFHLGAGITFPAGKSFRVIASVKYHFMGYDLKAVEMVQGSRDVNAGYIAVIAGILFDF